MVARGLLLLVPGWITSGHAKVGACGLVGEVSSRYSVDEGPWWWWTGQCCAGGRIGA